MVVGGLSLIDIVVNLVSCEGLYLLAITNTGTTGFIFSKYHFKALKQQSEGENPENRTTSFFPDCICSDTPLAIRVSKSQKILPFLFLRFTFFLF